MTKVITNLAKELERIDRELQRFCCRIEELSGGGGGGLLTASNGLTATGTNVTLGGALTQSTQIDGISLWDVDFAGLTGFSVGTTSGAITMGAFTDFYAYGAKVKLFSQSSNLELNFANGDSVELMNDVPHNITPSGFIVTDGAGIGELGYLTTAELSTLLGISSPTVTAANNGLNLSGTIVKLGGALLANTALSGAFTWGWSGITTFTSSSNTAAITTTTGAITLTPFTDLTLTLTGTNNINITNAITSNTNPSSIMVLSGTGNGTVDYITPSALATLLGVSAATVTGATNGLNLSGGNVRLGGALIANTTVNGASSVYSLDLENFSALTMGGGSSTLTSSSTTITISAFTSLLLSANSVMTFGIGGTEMMRVHSTGFVGINTNAPMTRLNVADTISTSPRGILSSQYSSDTAGARVGFSKARGTVTVPTVLVTGDTIGRLMFRGYDGTFAGYVESASIEVGSTGTIASATGRVPTFMAFSTGTDAATTVITEAMRITAAQFIGIGTTTPSSKLDITTNSLGVTQTTTSGLSLVNTTAAISGTQQISPALRLTGNRYNTTTTATQAISVIQDILPVQAASGALGATWRLRHDTNVTGTFVDALTATMGVAGSAITWVGNKFVFSSGGESVVESNFGLRLFPGNGSSGYGYGVAITPSSTTATAKLNIVGDNLTTAVDYGCLHMTQTWNHASANPTAIKLNVTNTTSASTALLMDLQVGGVSGFKVAKDGTVTTPTAFNSTGYYSYYGQRFMFGNGAGTNFAIIKGSGSGVLQLTNSAEGDFDMLQFGSSSSSFPGLKRVTTGLEVKLADNSAYTTLKASKVTLTNTISLPSTGAAATAGTATLVAGTVTVNTTAMTSTAILMLTRKTSGGTIGTAITYTQVNGTSFTINSDNILDTSTFVWSIIETY